MRTPFKKQNIPGAYCIPVLHMLYNADRQKEANSPCSSASESPGAASPGLLFIPAKTASLKRA